MCPPQHLYFVVGFWTVLLWASVPRQSLGLGFRPATLSRATCGRLGSRVFGLKDARLAVESGGELMATRISSMRTTSTTRVSRFRHGLWMLPPVKSGVIELRDNYLIHGCMKICMPVAIRGICTMIYLP